MRRPIEVERRWFAKSGSRFTDEDAAVIGPVLDALPERTAEAVLDEATSPASPLHPFYEWDDRIAAREHRLAQARSMLRSIEVEIIRPETRQPIRTRAFVTLATPGQARGERYVEIDVVLRDDDARRALLRQALSELISFKRRYSTLRELDSLFKEVEQIQETLDL